MLQMSYVDVAKVDRDVAYVAMAIHVCSKCVFKCFSISSGCCICCSGYTRMLQVSVPNISPVSDVCCKCFYLNVAYVTVVIPL
jgi:hypothetical protein